MIDREQLLANHPLLGFVEGRGARVVRGTTNLCPMAEHKPGHLCVTINEGDGLWNCNDCKKGGTVIDWMVLEQGITVADAMQKLGGNGNGHRSPPPPKLVPTNGAKRKLLKAYDYTDEKGVLLFQVCRLEPKDFRQRAPDGNGGWIYNLDGIRRVLFNLPEVIAADVVFIPEGEKDCETLKSMGLTATTNCGGSKKWFPEYSSFLRGKEIVILSDNDVAGEEHLETLKKALGKVVKSMRVVKMPEGIKDVSDFVPTFPSVADAKDELCRMCEDAEVLFQGHSVPVYTMEEMEARYEAHIKRATQHELRLGSWLPTFNNVLRPIVPGELVTFILGTGCGKTFLLQNLAINTKLQTLLFELELPDTLTFERFVAVATNTTGAHVESTYRLGQKKDWRATGKLDHVMCCTESGLTPERIRKIIDATALKTSVRPSLVLIDYLQLMGGESDSRYERTSDSAEQLKVIAKETNTIIVMSSQVSRPKDNAKKKDNDAHEVSLTDGKGSGSIENSSGLVFGGWRDAADPDRLWLRILKNTKGKSGLTVSCRIFDSLLVHEESRQEEPTGKP